MSEKEQPGSRSFLIGVVGPCGAGKSTLIAGLEREGFRCRHIAQEHSYVPSMWQKITHPDLLVFLDASFEMCTQRRKLDWREADYLEQKQRLAHAHDHADLIVETDALRAEEVLSQVVRFARSKLSSG